MDWVQWEYDIAMAMAFYFIFFLPGFSWFLGGFFFEKAKERNKGAAGFMSSSMTNNKTTSLMSKCKGCLLPPPPCRHCLAVLVYCMYLFPN